MAVKKTSYAWQNCPAKMPGKNAWQKCVAIRLAEESGKRCPEEGTRQKRCLTDNDKEGRKQEDGTGK